MVYTNKKQAVMFVTNYDWDQYPVKPVNKCLKVNQDILQIDIHLRQHIKLSKSAQYQQKYEVT